MDTNIDVGTDDSDVNSTDVMQIVILAVGVALVCFMLFGFLYWFKSTILYRRACVRPFSPSNDTPVDIPEGSAPGCSDLTPTSITASNSVQIHVVPEAVALAEKIQPTKMKGKGSRDNSPTSSFDIPSQTRKKGIHFFSYLPHLDLPCPVYLL